ncbi:hypothetical protein GLOIN_2v1838529 [Rhizophagus clarus]|uniref:Uncharacterized protein n=1 Tax=Rhizophagus clarus TaxID=94130 RepID=A0A8H3L5L4_9GLOM|nr:hypothetical protein GLOIN_2v1838529 [Rhizophagus clarus]
MAPTSEVIQSGQVHKRNININPNEIGSSIGNAAQNVGNSLNNATTDAGNTIQNVTDTAVGEIDKIRREALNTLLSAFDNFVPKAPTYDKSGWIARPIIIASIFNLMALILLLITNSNNKIYCYLTTLFILLVSFTFNLVSFIITFSLFSLVFNVIGTFPGIDGNHTGPAIILSGCSCLFLLVSLSLISFYFKASFYNFLLR